MTTPALPDVVFRAQHGRRLRSLLDLLRLLRLLTAVAVGAVLHVRFLTGRRFARAASCLAGLPSALAGRTRACPSATSLRALADRRRVRAADAGMTTAEYAVGTVAACGFAAVLYKAVTSAAVSHAISGVIERALHVGF